jgi:putative transposase
MTMSNLVRSNLFPYHITTRTNNKEWFDIPIDIVWGFCLQAIKYANEVHPIEVVSFVLMSNHYHLILRTPNSDLDFFMYEFNKHLSLNIRKRSGHHNSIFGGEYKWCLIRSKTYLYNCYRYVYQNPVRAKLTLNVEDYPYSSLFYLNHQKEFCVPLFDTFGFKDAYALSWLNLTVGKEELHSVRSGLHSTKLLNLNA